MASAEKLSASSVAALVALGCFVLSGCASVTGSSNQSVSVQTRAQTGKEVVGSACELTNNKGKWFVTTPGSVSIHRSNDDLQVLCNKEGMDPGRGSVVSDTKGSMFGNIILGGGIGAIVDHNNGTAYEYPNLIQIVMGAFSKVETPKPTDSVATQSSAIATTQVAVTANPATQPTNAVVSISKEKRLEELKSLFDKGLLSKETYLEQQRAILAAN